MNCGRILFVVSKSTGFRTLKSFLEIYNNRDLKILTLNDSNDTRSHFESIQQLCQKYQLECLTATSGKCLTQIIESYKPDYAFVCGWYWLISGDVLSKVPHGVYGIHNSLLPKYRGHAPLVWSLLSGDNIIGASFFEITEGMDCGHIFYQWSVEVKNRYVSDILEELESLIENEFGQKFIDIIEGRIKGIEQDHNKATYGAKRVPNDGLIDWTQNSSIIERQIKSLNIPYPLSFGYFDGKKIYIKKAATFPYPTYSSPGQVVFKEKNHIVIGCGGNTAIMVHEAYDEEGNSELASLFTKITSPLKYCSAVCS